MSLGPMVIVGCGGSGGAVVTALRNKLENHLRRSGWTEGLPTAWQLIWADTPSEREDMAQFGPAIPKEDYVCLSKQIPSVSQVHASVSTFLGKNRLSEIAGWGPNPTITVPVNKGAGQWRAVGRLAAIMSLASLGDRVDHAMKQISLGQGQLDRLVSHLGADGSAQPDPLVIVISSLAGGTGSGVFLDICDVIRAKKPELSNKLVGILFTAEIFNHLNLPGLEYNTVGALSELCAGYFAPPQEFPRIFDGAFTKQAVNKAPRGVTFPFIIGKKTFDGSSLDSTNDVYRSVTETLSSMFTNSAVYDEFTGKLITNWPSEQINHGINEGRGAFLNKQDGGEDVPLDGVVSSFGSARLCVGSEMFSEYAAHRMARDVVQFMHSGFLDMGKKSLGDQQASAQEVLRYFRERHGLAFIRACGLEEVNAPGENRDQILERLIPDSELRNKRIEDFIETLRTTVASGIPKELFPAQVESHVKNIYFTQEPAFVDQINAALDAKTRQFIDEVPSQVIAETSSYMAAYGVPVATEMIRCLDEHLESASRELQAEIQNYENLVSKWESNVASVFSKLRPKDKVDGRSTYTRDACQQAASRGYGNALIAVRKRAIELIADLRRQVLKSILLKLEQVSESLSGPEGINAVSSWPIDGGVPPRFAPSPLDFCLVEAGDWPKLYDDLLLNTVRRDDTSLNDPTDYVRRVIGSGGFPAEAFGSTQVASKALTVKNSWTRSSPIEFETAISVEDILSRAQLWINRVGTPLGDFSNIKLRAYLSESDASGNPEPEHISRMNKFNDKLDSALRFAQPLVFVDQSTFTAILGKPDATTLTTKMINEQMPFPPGSAARLRAEETLKGIPGVLGSNHQDTASFFSQGADTESVLFVSRLSGAVHPMLLASVTAPIHKQWTNATLDKQLASGVWQYRRARSLTDFIPVRPRVRQSLMRGWITGRLLGLISPPQAKVGPKIVYNGSPVEFLWPTVEHQNHPNLVDEPRKHLPAVLETISVAALLAGQSPETIWAYEALYKVGEDYAPIIRNYIRTGSSEGEIEGAAIVARVLGSDAQSIEDRRIALKLKLEVNKQNYKDQLGKIDQFGFELFEEIIAEIEQLEVAVQAPDNAGGDF
jgi:hypothetical protein